MNSFLPLFSMALLAVTALLSALTLRMVSNYRNLPISRILISTHAMNIITQLSWLVVACIEPKTSNVSKLGVLTLIIIFSNNIQSLEILHIFLQYTDIITVSGIQVAKLGFFLLFVLAQMSNAIGIYITANPDGTYHFDIYVI